MGFNKYGWRTFKIQKLIELGAQAAFSEWQTFYWCYWCWQFRCLGTINIYIHQTQVIFPQEPLQHDLGHLGRLPGLVLMRRQHWPDLAEQKGETHIDLVMPRPRDPSPTPAPKTKGSPLLSSPIPPMAEAAGTRPPPTMMAEESTPGQLFAQAANLPVVSTQ